MKKHEPNPIEDAAKSARPRKSEYRTPDLHVVGKAIDLVQGGGGSSGSDVRYYYYRLPNE